MSDLRAKLGKSAGRLASVARSEGVKFKWPESSRDRYDFVKGWHALAMQIAGKSTTALRALAVIPISFRYDAGVLRETDERLAERAACSAKTISRGIHILKEAGLLSIEHKSRWNGERTVTERTCFLSYPSRYHEGASIPGLDESVLDNGCPERPKSATDDECPERSDGVMDNGCPSATDNGCPPSIGSEELATNSQQQNRTVMSDRKTASGGGGLQAPAATDRHCRQELAKSRFRDEFGELAEDLEHQAILLFEKGLGVEEIIDRIRFKLIVRDIANAG